MPASFASIWLSRFAVVAMAIFGYCAWMANSLDGRSRTNRVAVAFNIVFALWAGAASFWYAADRATALALYRAFSWTWSIFPPLILHFTLRVTEHPVLDSKYRLACLAALYAPALALVYLVPAHVLVDPVFRGGYWMLAIERTPPYFFFVAHYFVIILFAIIVAFGASSRAHNRRAGRRFRLLGWSYSVAGVLGFITDTVFLYAGIDIPNLAIFWILILSAGMIVAMSRYGFLSRLPPEEALALLESMGEYVMYLDDSGRVVWMNPSAILAVGQDTLAGARSLAAADILPAELAVSLVAGFAADSAGSPDTLAISGSRSVSLGPEGIPVNLWVHRVGRTGTGGMVLTAVDLRPQFSSAKIERRLADSGILLDEFVARSLDGIVLTDAEGRIVRWNEPMVSMTGIGAEEALGAFYWDIRSSLEPAGGISPERIRSTIQGILAGRNLTWARRNTESRIQRRDASRRIIQYDSFPIPLAEGTILATIARDVTDERRQSEEHIARIRKLDHAQKMEAVGTLSGGIAHDFNNTLAGIIGAASLIRLGIDSGSIKSPRDFERELEMIERSSQRAASSVRRLMTLTRRRAPEAKVFRLDETLSRVAEFARSSMDQSVRVETPVELPQALVLGDAGLVEQLLLNLLINAEHAMTIMRPEGQKRGGTVTLGLSPFFPEKAFLLANPDIREADYWAVSVRDEGVGIPRHIQNRVFEPFYSTKTNGSAEMSSGLGLAMVHAIARQHGGCVNLKSEPGVGSLFMVYLPAATEATASVRVERRIRRGEGLVLVADDDDIPRETAVAALETLGYGTLAATSGAEARSLFGERPDEWKAVLLDRRLGDTDGLELARALREERPALPVVLASGLHDPVTEEADRGPLPFVILHKPYTIDELARALDAAFLEDPAASGAPEPQ